MLDLERKGILDMQSKRVIEKRKGQFYEGGTKWICMPGLLLSCFRVCPAVASRVARLASGIVMFWMIPRQRAR